MGTQNKRTLLIHAFTFYTPGFQIMFSLPLVIKKDIPIPCVFATADPVFFFSFRLWHEVSPTTGSVFLFIFQTAEWIKSAAVKSAHGPGSTSLLPNGFVFLCLWLTAHVFGFAHRHTHTWALCVHVICLFILSSNLCVNSVPAFMRLLEPVCVPAGAILAQSSPPSGAIWALLNISSPHFDHSF